MPPKTSGADYLVTKIGEESVLKYVPTPERTRLALL